MVNKMEKKEQNKPDENGRIMCFDHLLIRDKESGESILNRREQRKVENK